MACRLISVLDLTKTHSMGDVTVPALRGVSLDVHAGEFIAQPVLRQRVAAADLAPPEEFPPTSGKLHVLESK